ncbi:hypothetical protein PUNSTDRAFT_55250 [Punctularia strigosozonata HHB-11173 SS5]|uniref:RRM domain-containing protein n=1 Tax=Punctularia strigosozonata (strain HHB-11173) TaxID=741275 RepID=R7S5R2_PUNST|nr:uncharacterized protein PUNSTDRAFT_55250 [Punctularia strigosozonata HHB-11173 SS5]EIN04911.1 hypothetical protein PUNSTDRAFT_55250 [Punctularia strigosozonata HHB-11173 SS5]
MAPKKTGKQKMSLNEFLGDNALGSWADEMDSLPTAPAAREDDGYSGDRRGRDDFLSSRPDRGFGGPPREDLPLPSQPPYTAFVGNLAFDLQEIELEGFFAPSKTKSVKIIKDRDDRPKGFGYIEFETLDGLKDGISRSGTNLNGRTVRVSVAEPPKERGFGSGGFDDEKFASPWRRDGPLPDLPNSRESSRRPSRFDAERVQASASDGINDWRSSPRGPPPPLPGDDREAPSFRRKASGLRNDTPAGPADVEDTWAKGSKFKPSEEPPSRFGSMRGRGDMGPPPSSEAEGDWRSAARPRPAGRDSTSPSSSVPPTPNMGRRRLELLPRSNAASASPTPLSSPKMASAQATSAPRSNPFGDARPVDVSNREAAITERLEKEREAIKDKATFPMGRTTSQQRSSREGHSMSRSSSHAGEARSPGASIPSTPSSRTFNASAAGVRPAISFARAAGNKNVDAAPDEAAKGTAEVEAEVNEVANQLGETTI